MTTMAISLCHRYPMDPQFTVIVATPSSGEPAVTSIHSSVMRWIRLPDSSRGLHVRKELIKDLLCPGGSCKRRCQIRFLK